MRDQRGGHLADQRRVEFGLDDGIGPPAEIDHHARQGFIHRHIGRSHARDPLAIAQRFVQRAAQADRHVFDGVVRVDVQIAGGLDRQIKQPMMRDMVQHVIEETDPGGDVGCARAVQVQRQRDLRFVGACG